MILLQNAFPSMDLSFVCGTLEFHQAVGQFQSEAYETSGIEMCSIWYLLSVYDSCNTSSSDFRAFILTDY